MRAARVDANQETVVKALRAIGCKVYVSSSFGQGFPDLVVLTPRRSIVLLEVKDGNKPPSARKLTPDQEKFHELWDGGPVYVVATVDEAINAVTGGV